MQHAARQPGSLAHCRRLKTWSIFVHLCFPHAAGVLRVYGSSCVAVWFGSVRCGAVMSTILPIVVVAAFCRQHTLAVFVFLAHLFLPASRSQVTGLVVVFVVHPCIVTSSQHPCVAVSCSCFFHMLVGRQGPVGCRQR